MSWNDERVDLLSRLWLDGRSASQIATELGQGVTRNAVIGKVHRLGLSGRTKVATASTSTARLRPKAVQKPAEERESVPSVPIPIAPPAQTIVIAARTPDVVLPFSTRVTIMELRETMCRWPLGDPTSSDFRYCGSRTGETGPYCAEHARLAFQPTQDRRRVARIA